MRKFIGDRKFYKMVLTIAIPIMIQNGITNFVSLLDNIMVGQVGTDQMSGVAIVNQLLFVFYLAIFGGLSGAGIFTAQFYGKGDTEGVRNTFRFKILTAAVVLLVAVSVLIFGGEFLIRQFLHEGSATGNIKDTLIYGQKYLFVMLWGLFPFALNQCYGSTLREMGETMITMKAGIIAVFLNLILNYILIFGKLGFPVFGVVGAAIATVISRYVEMLIIVVWTHLHAADKPFIVGAYRTFAIPADLIKNIVTKGMPLLVNEIFWASGVTMLNQCYATRGLATVAAININSTIANLFNVVFIALGSSVAIIVGQLLGANKMEEAKETDTKLIAFSVFSCVIVGAVMAVSAPFVPLLYNTTEEVRSLATILILISAALMPLGAFNHASYFTLRSGGKTLITFLFDSVYMWLIPVPVAYFLSRKTGMGIIGLYVICQSLDFIKCIVGYYLIRGNSWLKNIVESD